ncbi:MAG: GDSL-type esterase/lipase family protein [Clostridiales bacterium]|nr:GDSL-type esterase/lipase family protein [Clostridiales bacterium]
MWILPDNKKLQYSGRIDFDEKQAPVLIYAASSVRMVFCGTTLKVTLQNHRSCWTNEMGYFVDGAQKKFTLSNGEEKVTYTLEEHLDEGWHELLLFKRMDSCHTVTFLGFEIDGKEPEVREPSPKPERRIEFFGDSVSCGEVSEAVEYVGKEDPVHDGEYSNSWYSYAWMTARKLNAEIHDTSQGGIALLDGTGWFAAPDYRGVESCYDKMEYHPDLGTVKKWEFDRFTPHVVVVAIGQNDNHPIDYMAEDYQGEKSVYWRKHYRAFVEKLMSLYPKAQIILATTILCHHENWDKSIDEVCREIGSERVHHFLYKQNGCGTPGHIRIPEAEEMSEELSAFIETLGESIWE